MLIGLFFFTSVQLFFVRSLGEYVAPFLLMRRSDRWSLSTSESISVDSLPIVPDSDSAETHSIAPIA